ncbi:MAG: serine/threonine protein kinase [Actinobacteria bacterium]|nr:MAG: serine/threonine protein kinase [Actinomycetota bacterium]
MSNAAPAVVQSELVLGRYRPLRPLGSGGSGSVWLARDEHNGLDVALKIVPREGKAASRAEREAEAAARLRHRSCQRAYGFGRDSRHVYIAYEYVPGRTFREALRGGELDDAAAIEASAQVLEALAHAHARGIVHRDVKPSNVLLAEGKDVSALVLDFGLAQMQEAETLTAQGDVPGTLAYIAPERLAGGITTEAADIWAVGVMLWEALAGRHPFWRSSLLETARAIEAGAPRLETMRPDLPRPLLAAVDRALDLDPARRPDAAALAGALRFSGRKRRRRGGSGRTFVVPAVLPRVAPALAAALVAGWCAWAIPFYPRGWPLGLAALAAAAAVLQPRLGLAFALAVPVFPLGNLALGAAMAYTVAAIVVLALSWREPRTGLLFSVGPLLAPLAALGLLPLATVGIRSPIRRTLQAAAAILTAGIVAGIRGVALPFDGSRPPAVRIAASDDPFTVVGALWGALLSRPALAVEALVIAAVAAALPYARSRGPWAVAGLGAAFLAAALLVVPSVAAIPLVVAVWATCLVVAVR